MLGVHHQRVGHVEASLAQRDVPDRAQRCTGRQLGAVTGEKASFSNMLSDEAVARGCVLRLLVVTCLSFVVSSQLHTVIVIVSMSHHSRANRQQQTVALES